MNRIIRWSLLSLVVLLGPAGMRVASAQTVNAQSCSSADVQTALNSVNADGTTVLLPGCSATWTSAVTYNQAFSTIIQGQSTTSGTCAPGGTCTPTDNTTIALNSTGHGLLNIATRAGKSFRLTGITFTMPSSAAASYGQINISGGSTAVRIDHCHFDDQVNGDHTLQLDGWNGVVDHNVFDSTNQSNLFFIQPTNMGSDSTGNAIWAQPDNFGTSNFIYAENNLFQNGTFVFDANYGGRLAFRFNIVGTNSRIQTHGAGSAPPRRSGRTVELYGNTFTFATNPSSSNYFAFLVDLEGGTGMEWGNTIAGFGTFIREDTVRTNNATYTQQPPPLGFGYCSSSLIAGILGPSPWDGNESGQDGYPCLDNVGRGQGDLLAAPGNGVFPVTNTATGTTTWPHQALSPHYAFANVFNTIQNITPHYWQNFDSVTVENRDYYLQLPNINESATFNGTAGIGQGPLASKPSACAPSVGWWATDQGNWNSSGNGIGNGVLYVCTATNTWTPYYTPYTYPHPLISGTQSSGAPVAPSDLAATVN
jgi:pectate lyase